MEEQTLSTQTAEDLKSEPCTVMGLRDATFSRKNEQEKKTHLPITKRVIRKIRPFLTLDIRIMATEIIVSLKLVQTCFLMSLYISCIIEMIDIQT